MSHSINDKGNERLARSQEKLLYLGVRFLVTYRVRHQSGELAIFCDVTMERVAVSLSLRPSSISLVAPINSRGERLGPVPRTQNSRCRSLSAFYTARGERTQNRVKVAPGLTIKPDGPDKLYRWWKRPRWPTATQRYFGPKSEKTAATAAKANINRPTFPIHLAARSMRYCITRSSTA